MAFILRIFGFMLFAAAPLLAAVLSVSPLNAQIDPMRRSMLQLGYNQPLQGRSPVAGYGFYYLNRPKFYKNTTFRMALAPVYVDTDFGFPEALGENVDVTLGFAGGGFADSYTEIRRGQILDDESFTGHGGETALGLYYRFNPGQLIPFVFALKGRAHYATYRRDLETPESFEPPPSHMEYTVRTGLRLAGREPKLFAGPGLEVSVWYQGEFRAPHRSYGFKEDRSLNDDVHLLWSNWYFSYTFESRSNVNFSAVLGSGVGMDRLSAYRLGGELPLSAEFPLDLPGYNFQEITADRFALFGAHYNVPIPRTRCWAIDTFAKHARVRYLPGFEQPGHGGHTGLGSGIIFVSPRKVWKMNLSYSYGVNALRPGTEGAHAMAFLLQYDFEARRKEPEKAFNPGANPNKSRGLNRLDRLNRIFR